MPSAGNRSKKVAAKAAQRKAIVAEKKRVDRLATSLPARVGAAALCPVHRCFRGVSLFELGFGYLVLARRLPSNTIAHALFIVDTYCLGVKDVVFKEVAPSDFDDLIETLGGEESLVDMDPDSARKLAREAVAYAADCGLAPGKDYAVIEKLFGDADSRRSSEQFVFGLDGKPVYVQSDMENSDRVREVTRILTARFGPLGWDIVRKTDMYPRTWRKEEFDDEEFMAGDGDRSDPEVLDGVDYERIESTPDVVRDT